jgi:hypothetical protein
MGWLNSKGVSLYSMRVWIKILKKYSPWGGGATNLRELDLEDGV